MTKTLYKYRDYSARALEVIINRQVYFATSEQLNDPFDCRIDIVGALEAARNEAAERGFPTKRAAIEKLGKLGDFYSRVEADIAKAGILSLARSPVSAPMWAHYASNHKGFLLGFRLSEMFTKHYNAGIIGMVPVRYCNDNPFTTFFHEFASKACRVTNIEETQQSMWTEFWQSIFSVGLTSKSKAWKYEKEVRVLRKEGGLVSFDPAELVEVVFGMDMPVPARKVVLNLLESRKWQHVKLKEIQRGTGFTLQVVDV